MAGLSTYAAEALLNWIKGTAMPTAPAGVYVALYNGDPGNDGTGGTDVTADVNSAGRQTVSFGVVDDKNIANDSDVEFGNSESAVNITHFGLWDAATSGNFLGGNSLDTSRSVAVGDPVTFLTGDLDVDITPK